MILAFDRHAIAAFEDIDINDHGPCSYGTVGGTQIWKGRELKQSGL